MNFKTFDIFEGVKKAAEVPEKDSVLPESFLGLIVGKPDSGKSKLCETLLKNHNAFYKKFDILLIIGPTPIGDIPWSDDYCSPHFSTDWVLARIEHFKKNIKKEEKEEVKVLLIYDDVITSIKKAEYDVDFQNLIYNRRHIVPGCNISILITTQKYTRCPTPVRSTATFIIMFQVPHKDFKSIKEEHIYSSMPHIDSIIFHHFRKFKHNFVYIRLDKYNLFLNFEKLV